MVPELEKWEQGCQKFKVILDSIMSVQTQSETHKTLSPLTIKIVSEDLLVFYYQNVYICILNCKAGGFYNNSVRGSRSVFYMCLH